MNLTMMSRLAIALAVGLIIGMERGWASRASSEGQRIAGIRSFGFVGLFGGLSAVLAEFFDVSVLAIALLSFTAIVVTSYSISTQKTSDIGITTELSLFLTFLLGALAGKGFGAEALATGVITAVLLRFKQEIHQSLQKLDQQELVATLQLLLIAALALPLLPNQNLGPWNALNPRAIGWLILLIASISYVGYFAMKLLGTRVGLLSTAVLGALVSSTAVTVSFARIARRGQASLAVLGAGISLAAATMAVRILLEVSLVNSALIPWLIAPIAILAIVPGIAAVIITLRKTQREPSTEIPLKNPIELGSALGYGMILSLLFVLIRAIEAWFGNAGIYALSAISGITDVDAVSLSLAQATKTGLPLSVGATGILIAAMVNTVIKAIFATVIGGWELARWCATILLGALGMSLIAVVLTFTPVY
jgi:uncharacterized membrane protein (DUF4010 family)